MLEGFLRDFTFTTLAGDYSDGLHAVVVVGFTESGNVIYMDPMETSLREADGSYFGQYFNYCVKSNK